MEESESILGQPFRKILMQHTLLHIHRAVFSKLNYHLQCNGAVHYTHFTYGRLVSIYSGSSTHICCKKNYVVLTCQVSLLSESMKNSNSMTFSLKFQIFFTTPLNLSLFGLSYHMGDFRSLKSSLV